VPCATSTGWRPRETARKKRKLVERDVVARVIEADARDPVPDAVWAEAARHFDETQLAAILLSIAMANTWNRLNIATPSGRRREVVTSVATR
jgi:alkylhydroperoxidase family enzyme